MIDVGDLTSDVVALETADVGLAALAGGLRHAVSNYNPYTVVFQIRHCVSGRHFFRGIIPLFVYYINVNLYLSILSDNVD